MLLSVKVIKEINNLPKQPCVCGSVKYPQLYFDNTKYGAITGIF